MPGADAGEWTIDTAALRAHLIAKGLVPGSSKWHAVWFRKCRKFGAYK